jgi:putative exporter of polyketide antibiotics
MRARSPAIAMWLWASAPRLLFAEVSDKCTSVEEHWFFAVPLSIVSFLVARRWWWVFPMAVLFAALVSGTMELPYEEPFGAGLLQSRGGSTSRACGSQTP